MVGKYYIEVRNKRISFKIDIKRSVTIIRGYSGTGKSTFINMLESALDDNVTGVSLRTDYDVKKIEVVRNERQLQYIINNGERDMILVADENLNLTKYEYFVEYLKSSGAYLIYVTRKNRTGLLQFAVDEIYRFESKTQDDYTAVSMYPQYEDKGTVVKPDVIVTEDSNSGHDIVEHIVSIPVKAADGKDNVVNTIDRLMKDGHEKVYAVVDCAAFGNCMEKAVRLGAHILRVESFEYMMLNTYIFNKELDGELTETYSYAESSVYYTWEQYYTALLQNLCRKYPGCTYKKERWGTLNNMFKSERFLKEISGQLSDLDESVKEI